MQMQTDTHLESLQRKRARLGRIGLLAGASLVGFSVMATFGIQLSGAVIASGHVIPQGENIIIQHPDGGLVKDVLYEDGDKVENGAEILRFDGAELTAELGRLEGLKLTLDLRIASSRAALNGEDTFLWQRRSNPLELRRRASAGQNEGVGKLKLRSRARQVAYQLPDKEDVKQSDSVIRQKAALQADRALYRSRVQQIRGRINSSQEARLVLRAQLVSIKERSSLIDGEIEELEVLVEERLVPRSRMASLQRERLEIRQRTESLRLEDTRLQGDIALAQKELINLQNEDTNRLWSLLQADEQELAEVEFGISDVKAQLGRLALIAPASGRIHELSVQNPGTVVQEGAVILQIVPEGRTSEVSVQIDLASIDDVGVGKSVRLRFDTFKEHAATELQGEILQISPDRSLDPVTGLPFYSARIGLDAGSIEGFQKIGPSAGAPVTVMIETKKRSMADYLLEPVQQALFKTFSET